MLYKMRRPIKTKSMSPRLRMLRSIRALMPSMAAASDSPTRMGVAAVMRRTFPR